MKTNYIIFSFVACLSSMLTSCADKYNIKGSSIRSLLDGNTVLLTKADNGVMQTIDSCKVMHGNFTMCGNVDSTTVAVLDMGDFKLPVVLEPGNIKVSSSDNAIKIEGTPMNDELYKFLNSRDSLIMLLTELPRKESQMILDGNDHDIILRLLGEEEADIRNSMDKLETEFITRNYDNVLGVCWFLQICDNAYQRFGYATTTPQIDEIYLRAPDSFKNNSEVQKYMQQCK